jgi:thioredoxin 1
MESKLQALRGEHFEGPRLARPGVWLVELGASWCPVCRAMEPILVQLARDLAGIVGVATVDVDQEVALADCFDVSTLPTLMVFRDGQLIARRVGGASRRELLWLLHLAVDEPRQATA